MKVLLVGDTHCDTTFAINVTDMARELEVETIVQLGDFCLRLNESFLRVWSDWLDEDDSRLFFWLDGNHDDHDFLDEMTDGADLDHPVAFWHENMYYCPRGSVTKLGDTTVMFMGGAHSIDWMRRTPGVDWWPQETIKDHEVDRAIDNAYDVDVICSHDCPETIWFGGKLDEGDYKVDRASEHNRKQVTRLVEAVLPWNLYHGHYHESYSTMSIYDGGVVGVHGLGANIKHTDNGRSYPVPAELGENVTLVDW